MTPDRLTETFESKVKTQKRCNNFATPVFLRNFARSMEEFIPYLDFLRYCLDDQAALPPSVSKIDWERLYAFARRQTIEATYWRGMERLDRSGQLKLSEEVVLGWMARIKKIEKDNRTTYRKAAWVWKNFMKEGFRSCLLKGQGNALLYPTPYMRTPGDIDIWVEGGDKKVIAYIDSILPGSRRIYHHIDFINAGKIPIEVHYRPSWMSNPLHNKRLQRWFLDHSDACFSNKEEEWGFCVPTFQFNCVFLLTHIFNHLLREGVGLRHVIDYYHLLTRNAGQPRPTEKELRHLGLLKIAGALMWVLQEYTGIDRSLLLCEPNERVGRLMMREILLGGNFGKYDQRALGGVAKNAMERNLRVGKRDLLFLKYFPSECLCEPIFRIRHFFWRQRH